MSIEDSISNMSYLLDDMMTGKLKKQDVMSLLIASLKESAVNVERQRKEMILKMITIQTESSGEESKQGEENNSFSFAELLPDKEVKQSKVPCLF